jgi:hypothetical protein
MSSIDALKHLLMSGQELNEIAPLLFLLSYIKDP